MSEESKHIEIRVLIEKYVWHQATDDERLIVEKAIASDAELMKEFNKLSKLYLLSNINADQDKIDVSKAKNKFYYKIKSESEIDSPTERKIIPLFVKIISGIAALFVLVISIQYLFSEQEKPNMVISSLDSVVVDTLPDGSVISLNNNSTVTYISNNSKERRLEFKSGEVFFDIERDPEKPFIVDLGEYTVTVLGTSFNILHTSSDSINVSVVSGKVQIQSKRDSSLSHILVANENAILTKSKPNILSQSHFNDNTLFWKTRVLQFEEVNIVDALSEIEEAYNVNVKIIDSSFVDCYLTAKYNNQDIKDIMEIIEFTFDASIAQESNNFYITKTKSCQ